MRRLTIWLSWGTAAVAAIVTGVLALIEAYAAEDEMRGMQWTTALAVSLTVALAAAAVAAGTTAAWSQGWADRARGPSSGATRIGIGMMLVGGVLSLVFLPAVSVAISGALVILIGVTRREPEPATDD